MRKHKLYSFLFAGILITLGAEASAAIPDMNQFGYGYAPARAIRPKTEAIIASRLGGESVYVIPPAVGGLIGGFVGGAIVWPVWTFAGALQQSHQTLEYVLTMGGLVSEARRLQWINIWEFAVSELVSSYLFLGYELKAVSQIPNP